MFGETEEHRRRSFRMWSRRLVALGCVVAAIAVVGGGGADASPAEGPSARSTQARTVPAARAASATYLFKAEFGVGYEVEWTERSGSQTDDCAEWRISRGTNEVNVGSNNPRRRTTLAIPGRIVVSPSRNLSWGPANLQGVGPAAGTVHRTLIQTGGSTWVPDCGGTPPPPFVAPANDCGGGRARPYSIPNAALTAALMRGTVPLDRVTELTTLPSSSRVFAAIAVSASPGRSLYRNCRTSAYAPEYPGYVKLRVTPADMAALRRLKPGQKRRIQKTWEGPCKDDDEIPQEAACRFKLDVHVDIRRWRPGEPFP